MCLKVPDIHLPQCGTFLVVRRSAPKVRHFYARVNREIFAPTRAGPVDKFSPRKDRPQGGTIVPDYVCLFFDRDGIVRATDTVAANELSDAVAKAHKLLAMMTSLERVELWREGVRVYDGTRDAT